MSLEKIDIAEFGISTDRAEKALNSLEKGLLDAGKSVKHWKDQIKDSQKTLDEHEVALKTLRKEGKQNTDEYNNRIQAVKKGLKTQESYINQLSKEKAQQKDLRRVYNDTQKAYSLGIKKQKLSIEGYKTEGKTQAKLEEDKRTLIALRKREVELYGKSSKEAKKYNDAIDKIHKASKSQISTDEKRIQAIGEYKNQLKEAFTDIKNGSVKAGVAGLTSSLKGMSLAFLSNPLGVFAIGLTAVGAGLKSVIDYNQQASEKFVELSSKIDLPKDQLKQLRAELDATSDYFELDFNTLSDQVDNISERFDISPFESLKKIREDLIAVAPSKRDEFLEQLREYGVQAKNAKISYTDFSNIVKVSLKGQLPTDKLIDAFKEINLRLSNPSDGLIKSLDVAFGSKFTDELTQGVSSGAITMKEAIALITAESEKTNLSVSTQKELTKQLFAAAGEDAGGYNEVLSAINESFDDNNNKLTEFQELQKRELEISTELEKKWALLFDSSGGGLDSLIIQGKIWVNEVLLSMINGGISLYNNFVDLSNQSKVFRGVISTVLNAGDLGFRVFVNTLKGVGASLVGVGKIFKGAFTLDGAEVSAGINKLQQGVKDTLLSPINAIKKSVDNVIDYTKNGANKLKAISSISASATSSGGVAASDDSPVKNGRKLRKTSTRAKPKASSSKKEVDKASKERLKSLKDQANVKIQIAKQELSDYILYNQLKLKEGEKFDAEILKREKEKAEKIKKLNLLVLESETAEKKRQIQNDTSNQGAKNEKLRLLEAEHKANVFKVEQDYNESIAQAQEQKKEQDTVDKAESLQVKLEELEEHWNAENEIKLAQAEYDLEQGVITEEQYESAKLQVKENTDAKKLEGTKHVLGQTAELLGEHTAAGKAAGVATATINTYQGVTEIWKSPAVLPAPLDVASKIIASGIALKSGLASVKEISKTKTPKAEHGAAIMFKGNTHANGGNTLYDGSGNPIIETQRDEMAVVLNTGATGELSRLSALNQKHGGIALNKEVSFAARGGVVPSRSTVNQSNFKVQVDFDYDRFEQAATNATYNGSYSGNYEEREDSTILTSSAV